MEIVKPFVEIKDDIYGEEVLRKIEGCARVCYKSEHKVTEDSARKFVWQLIRSGHLTPLEHVTVTVMIVCDRGVSHELVRHRLASYCVTGDTEIISYADKKSRSPKRRTIAEIYRWTQDPKCHAALRALTIRSMDEQTHTIIPSKVKNVFHNGIQDVYQVNLQSGRSIKCTKGHRFFTPHGWKQLAEVSVGDDVYSNGLPLLENEDWIRHNYLTLNKTRKQVAKDAGCCESTLYKAFQRFGIFKPWSDRPNRHPGRGVKGMFSEEQRKQMSLAKQGEKNPSYKANREELGHSGARAEARRLFNKDKCDACDTRIGLEIHHIDKNPHNNNPSNIKILCPHHHHAWHHAAVCGAFPEKITDIKYIGREDVYDIEVEGEYHNYVANGIVVHNSQESTRFCDYHKSGIQFIEPAFDLCAAYDVWEKAMKQAESAYLRLRAMGISPELARAVLPNALKTELYITANLRELRHILQLRAAGTTGKPHPQMQALMRELLKKLKAAIPVVFDDILDMESA